MKKLIFLCITFSIFHSINAQESEISNKLILGGSANFLIKNNLVPSVTSSFNSGIFFPVLNNSGESRSSTFTISPYTAKEINRRLTLGLFTEIKIVRSSADLNNIGQSGIIKFERNGHKFALGLFTRHVLNLGNKFNFYLQPYLSYNLLFEEEVRDSITSAESKVTFIELGIGAGVMYSINNKIRLTLRTPGLRYINGKWHNRPLDSNFNSLTTSINLSAMSIGFEVRI